MIIAKPSGNYSLFLVLSPLSCQIYFLSRTMQPLYYEILCKEAQLSCYAATSPFGENLKLTNNMNV